MVSDSRLSRRQMLRASLFAASVAAAPGCVNHLLVSKTPTTKVSARRPNLVLLVTDDQRSESLGCAGNTVIQTPNIDGLAARGVRFTQSFATTAICMSSRASILTGMYTRVHGIDDFTKPLARNLFEQSYPMLLRKAGYRIGFVGKWGVDGGEMPKADYDYFQGYQGQGKYFSAPGSKHLTVTETEQALEFLHGCKQEQPFCLAISFKAPHIEDEGLFQPQVYSRYPYDRALDPLYVDDIVPPIKTVDAAPLPQFLKESLNCTREASDFYAPNYQEAMKDLYRLVSGVDIAVGKIVEALEQLGFDDNTVIIYTADHGSFYGEHGFGGKWLMYEEAIRTPMIVCDPRLPKERRGTTSDEMVLNLDVPATVLSIAGILPPSGMQGKSIMPLVLGETPAWRTEWFYENHFRNQKAGPIAASEGIRTRDWKYIRYIDTDPMCEQLYDLNSDPREERNLAGDPMYAEHLSALRARWKIWTDKLDTFSIAQRWSDPV